MGKYGYGTFHAAVALSDLVCEELVSQIDINPGSEANATAGSKESASRSSVKDYGRHVTLNKIVNVLRRISSEREGMCIND